MCPLQGLFLERLMVKEPRGEAPRLLHRTGPYRLSKLVGEAPPGLGYFLIG